MQQAWAGRHIVVLNWRDLDHPLAGGAEVFAESVAEQLAVAGVRVTLLTARPRGQAAVVARRGFTIRRSGGTFGVYPAALRWLTAHRKDIDAVIDCQNGIPFFSPLVLRRRTPVIQLIHHVHQRQFRLFFGPVAAAIGRQLEGRGARIVYRRRPSVSVSPSTRTDVRAALRLRGPRYLVPNGLVLPASGALRNRSPTPSVICLGRLVPHKRIELLLHAIPALNQAIPGLCVHIVGDGPEQSRLQALAARLGLGDDVLMWHGRLPDAERDRLLGTAWLMVNPTHGEGWGIGVLEAAAFGVPALAFNVAGMRDSVRHGQTGWLAQEGANLADAITRALNELENPSAAEAFRGRCLAWAAQFGWERSADQLQRILSAERAFRSRRRPERRSIDTFATVVNVCDAQAHGVGLRATDLVFLDDGDRRALLYGADVVRAQLALARTCGCEVVRPATSRDHLLACASPAAAGRQVAV